MPHIHNRKLIARIWLYVTFCLITAAHYFFYRFSMDPLNTFAITRGLTFGCTLWTTVFLVAVWLRRGWARYILITLICGTIGGFAFCAMLLASQSVDPLPLQMRRVVAGLVLYSLALVPLGGSRSLRRYLEPRTAGE